MFFPIFKCLRLCRLVIIPTDYCKSTVCSLIILMLNVTRFHSSNWKSSQASEHRARMFLPCQWMLTIVWVLRLISNEDPGCSISSIMSHKCLTLTSDRFGNCQKAPLCLVFLMIIYAFFFRWIWQLCTNTILYIVKPISTTMYNCNLWFSY